MAYIFFNIIDGRVLFYNLWNTKRRPWILFELFKNYLIKTLFLWIKSPSIYQSSTNIFFFNWTSILFCFFAHFQNCFYVCFNVNNCKNLLARAINYMNIFILVWCFCQSIFYFASFFFFTRKTFVTYHTSCFAFYFSWAYCDLSWFVWRVWPIFSKT